MTDDLRRRQVRAIRDQILFHVDLHDIAHQVVERCRQRGAALASGLQVDETEDGREYVVIAEIGAGNWESVGSVRRIIDREESEARIWRAIADASEE